MKEERTLIIGAYGFGNMGDEAILQGILEEMNNKENVDVVSATPKETETLHGVRAVPMNSIDYIKYSTVVLGGGGYCPGTYEVPMKVCLKLKEEGARLIVRAIGPTPEIAGKENFSSVKLGIEEKDILAEIIRRADCFSVRTHKDLERMKEYANVDREVKVELDPAYNISFSKGKGRELLEKIGFSMGDKLCGISLAKFGYRKGLKNFIEGYKNRFTFVPIPMSRHYYAGFENDVLLLQKYFKEFGLLSRDMVRWMKYPFTPSELKSVLSNLTYLITARKHAMILALGSGLNPQQILLLGTRESGMAEYFDVEEIDWRQWPRSPDDLRFIVAEKKFAIKRYVKFVKGKREKSRKLIQWLTGRLPVVKHILTYRRTLRYLLKKRGIRAVYKFLFIKFFSIAGGEGAGNWLGSFIMPVFRLLPQLMSKLVPYPFSVEIEITNKCNKECLICEHTYWNEPDIDLKFEEFKRIVDQFPKLKWVNLTGEGDAFLNKDYLKMIEYLKSKDIPVFLVDSFDLISKEVAQKLIRMNVDGIWVSMDAATRETYEKIKVGCNFERTLNNIKNLIELKKRMKSPIPEICFRYIVTTLNIQETFKFVELVHSLGNRNSLGDGSQIEFAGLLVFDEIQHLFVPEIPEDILRAIMKKGRELNVSISFSHSNRRKLLSLERCTAWAEPYIMMGGYVLPCCAVLMSNKRPFLRKYSFGNILEKPFKEIWYSKRYREFRKTVCNNKGKVPILCKGCRAYNTLDRERKYGVTESI